MRIQYDLLGALVILGGMSYRADATLVMDAEWDGETPRVSNIRVRDFELYQRTYDDVEVVAAVHPPAGVASWNWQPAASLIDQFLHRLATDEKTQEAVDKLCRMQQEAEA